MARWAKADASSRASLSSSLGSGWSSSSAAPVLSARSSSPPWRLPAAVGVEVALCCPLPRLPLPFLPAFALAAASFLLASSSLMRASASLCCRANSASVGASLACRVACRPLRLSRCSFIFCSRSCASTVEGRGSRMGSCLGSAMSSANTSLRQWRSSSVAVGMRAISAPAWRSTRMVVLTWGIRMVSRSFAACPVLLSRSRWVNSSSCRAA
mmetsp:Transcript_36832/g.105560  ORF Transcript_36832/g.105560 Transcript_36832/m.105560 type:complete len:212 (-) Transcript_36832:1253-1888(-)